MIQLCVIGSFLSSMHPPPCNPYFGPLCKSDKTSKPTPAIHCSKSRPPALVPYGLGILGFPACPLEDLLARTWALDHAAQTSCLGTATTVLTLLSRCARSLSRAGAGLALRKPACVSSATWF